MKASEQRPSSVIHGRDSDGLTLALPFYVGGDGTVIDVTAGTRKMWANVQWPGHTVFADIDPAVQPDVVCSWDAVPYHDASFDAIVFDPPHLPAAAASPASLQQYIKDYGLVYGHKDEIGPAALFHPFLVEACRLLRPDGVVLAKLKDYVHNHRYQWTLTAWVDAVRRIEGLTPCDLIVKVDPCGGNLKSGRWQKAYHVRNSHCWWAIVRKGRCEPRRH